MPRRVSRLPFDTSILDCPLSRLSDYPITRLPDSLIPRSEAEPDRPLHDPRVARRGGLAERRVDLCARRVEACGGVDGAELRVIQHVVHFPPELEPLRAAGGDVLEDR